MAALGVIVLLAAAVHVAGDALLTHFVRPRLEAACATRLPGSRLQLGALYFDVWRNRLRCDSVELTLRDGAHTIAGPIVVGGMRWGRFLLGNRDAALLTRTARVEVANFSAETPSGEYHVNCGSLHVSVPDSTLTAQGVEIEPTASDEAFFAADPFRRIRYEFSVAACTLRGVRFADVLSGRAYEVDSVELQRPVLDSCIDREKPRRPPTANPRMPGEALAALAQPFRIGRLALVDGAVRMAARRSAVAEPGVLAFTAVQLTAKGIANARAGGRLVEISAAGRLMGEGTLQVQMQIPVTSPTLALHYAGTLEPMDLTCLDQYLDGTARFKIRSGTTSGAAFDIDVADGHARGALKGIYRDFHVSVLNRETGSEKGVANRVATVLADEVKVRHDNLPRRSGAVTEGKVDYVRPPEESFLHFVWSALRSGIENLMTK